MLLSLFMITVFQSARIMHHHKVQIISILFADILNFLHPNITFQVNNIFLGHDGKGDLDHRCQANKSA